MGSTTDKTLQNDLDFSRDLINNIMKKSADPVPQSRSLSEAEKKSMKRDADVASRISGLQEISSKEKKNSLVEECQFILEAYPQTIPQNVQAKVEEVLGRIQTYENFLLRFLQKYR